MRISEMDIDQLSQTQITKLIFGDIRDEGQMGDWILVFGSLGSDRVHKAVDLYRAGRAKKILMSGGTRYGKWETPEALSMRAAAVEAGVPSMDIAVECASNNTTENVLASLLVLEREVGLNCVRRILAVSSLWHMRRCMLTLRTYMPDWIQCYACPPSSTPTGQAHNWWMTDADRARVMKEARSLTKYVKAGHLLDDDVPI